MSESSVQLPPNSTLVIGEETAQTARKRKVEQNVSVFVFSFLLQYNAI